MDPNEPGSDTESTLDEILGYLNFSSGAVDSNFLRGLNTLYARMEGGESRRRSDPEGRDAPRVWRSVVELLQRRLASLNDQHSTFADARQAAAVLEIVKDKVVPAYMMFHRDLLFHQTEDDLFGPFMLGRVCEKVLSLGLSRENEESLVQQTLDQLNCFLGHRPVAALETQKIEPRPHEWVRPIPVYIDVAGVAIGKYGQIIQATLDILRRTDEDLLRAACFDPDALEELAIDPRAYDFDHPVNKRPNYQFGEWDPHYIDSRGRFRRFVVREVTIQALDNRVAQGGRMRRSREELVFEAGAVLAGTILMASGISGSGPDAHDSNTSLMTLIPRIAAYRDAFYERLLERMTGDHADRLRAECKSLHQPFGGARQHLNTQLAQQRASQLAHVKLARVFAHMGYLGAAQRQAESVPVASARMLCQIDCALTAGRQAIAHDDRQRAIHQLNRVMELLKRGIDCGAIVDPWNILGFDANFGLFASLEDSVRDDRIDELLILIDRIFDLYARVWSDAAAANDQPVCQRVAAEYEESARWWHQFAAHEVSSVESRSVLDDYQAARKVAEAFHGWHQGGAVAGDVGFWAPFVASFQSAKAYVLVIETLLARDDYVSAMSLLIHWLGKAASVPLESRDCSFNRSALRWVKGVVHRGLAAQGAPGSPRSPAAGEAFLSSAATADPWKLLRKFFDYVEANAEEYGEVPKFEAGGSTDSAEPSFADEDGRGRAADEEEESTDLFRAAYEDVVFRDSADDGIDDALFDPRSTSNDELECETERIVDRLGFLSGLAGLWTFAAAAASTVARQQPATDSLPALREGFRGWYRTATRLRIGLLKLADRVHAQKIPRPGNNHESMLEYDRHRLIREALIEQTLAACLDVSEAERFLFAAGASDEDRSTFKNGGEEDALSLEMQASAGLLAAALAGKKEEAEWRFGKLLPQLATQQILFVPLSRGGDPREAFTARIRKRIIEDLLVLLPRLGLVGPTLQLLDTARQMERSIPPGRGAVTQFDELFAVGFGELVDLLVRSTAPPHGHRPAHDQETDSLLVSCLEQLTEIALSSWLRHSRTLRLSVLERVSQPAAWSKLVRFIECHGHGLFSQQFLILGNVRAILHMGVENWLQESASRGDSTLDDDLRQALKRREACEHLTLILEAIVENYHEYRDYNSTTTQSDRGDLLYMLLDFLRLRNAYDRVAWNLKPVVQAHEVLVRRGRSEAAQLWRRMLAERIGEEADRYVRKLTRLQRKHAMRMASVAERINERFLLPMTIDRMRALVRPAIDQVEQPRPHHAFEILEEECELLIRDPRGAAGEIPTWLEALEDEIERTKNGGEVELSWATDQLLCTPLPADLADLQEQLEGLLNQQREQRR